MQVIEKGEGGFYEDVQCLSCVVIVYLEGFFLVVVNIYCDLVDVIKGEICDGLSGVVDGVWLMVVVYIVVQFVKVGGVWFDVWLFIFW